MHELLFRVPDRDVSGAAPGLRARGGRQVPAGAVPRPGHTGPARPRRGPAVPVRAVRGADAVPPAAAAPRRHTPLTGRAGGAGRGAGLPTLPGWPPRPALRARPPPPHRLRTPAGSGAASATIPAPKFPRPRRSPLPCWQHITQLLPMYQTNSNAASLAASSSPVSNEGWKCTATTESNISERKL